MNKGTCDYSGHNGMCFIVNNEDEDDEEFDEPADEDENSYLLEWQDTPLKLAKALREAADFLEKNADAHINVDID